MVDLDDSALRGLLEGGEQDFLRAILDNIEDGIVACDAAGVLRYFNRATVEMHGLPHAQLPAEHWSEHYSLFHADGLTPLTRDEVPLVRALRGEVIKNVEMVIAPVGKRPRHVTCSGRALHTSDGAKIGAVVSMHEITDRHRAEAERARRTRVESLVAELRESERRFRHIADNSPIMIWVTLPSGECVYLNRPWYEFTGQNEETGLGFGWLDAVHPEDSERAGQIFREANAAHEPFRLEYRLIRHDGAVRWCIDAAAPRFDVDGVFMGYVGSVIDITERRLAEEAVREEARRKDEFLAMLAHELRNPLAAIQSARQLLAARLARGEQAERCVTIIERQTMVLGQLVEDLLDVSRISRGVVELRREQLHMQRVVEHALAAVDAQIEARGHHVETDLVDEPLIVSGDAVRLEQIVVNLLTNAIKYTPPGGDITVRLQRLDEAWLRLEVSDTGIGIEPAFLSRVFELFEQAQRSLDRAQGGLGIGLTVIKYLVELHGGTIEAHSEGRDQGSRFVVCLPLEQAPRQSPPPPSPAADACGTNLGTTSPLDILVVDDNRDAAETLAELLETVGYEARVLFEGHQALESIVQRPPDVVLLDIGLPGIDGYEIARRVRASGIEPPPYLVAVTGYGQEADRARSSEAGFDVHLVKPLDFDQLLEVLAARAPQED